MHKFSYILLIIFGVTILLAAGAQGDTSALCHSRIGAASGDRATRQLEPPACSWTDI